MSASSKTIWMIVFAVLAVVLIAFSRPDDGLKEGMKGSYLGRAVGDRAQVSEADIKTLVSRAAPQRY